MISRGTVAVVLGLLTGLALGQLLAPSPDVRPNSSAQERSTESAAVAFYEAMNRFLELGDPALLTDTLNDDFVDHSAIGPDHDAAGLVRYLAAKRTAYPDMRMDVADMTPRDDRIAVAVAATGGTAAVARDLIPDRLPSTPGYEQLRIVNDKVAERWASQTLPPQYELFASLDLRHLSGWFVECVMEPLMLAPGASESRRQFSHSLLIAGSGTVALEIERRDSPDAPLLLSGDPASPTALRRGARVELANESVVVLPEGESYRVWNTGKQPASVIIVEIHYRSTTETFHSGQIDRIDPGVQSEPHFPAGLLPMGTDADRAHTLSLVRMVAAPGEMLPIHTATGLEQLIVVDGMLNVELHAGDVAVFGLDGLAMAAPGDRPQLLPGEGIAADSGTLLSYRVSADDPATIWFVTLVRAPVAPE